MTNKEVIRRGARVELARRDFFAYCQIRAPDFYRNDRVFLQRLCRELQEFYYSNDKVLVINMPPRHGKSRTIGCFVEWVLGKNRQEKIITGSYNEELSKTFARGVRNAISEGKVDAERIVYADIFPNTRIKRGESNAHMWSLENGYNNYLATSPNGTATGFGASILIIDDLVKSAYEANNGHILEGHWEWFRNTMLSRLEEGGKIIVVMTRWHQKDLAGRITAHYRGCEGFRQVVYPAMDEDGRMLCDEILSAESFLQKKRLIGEDIAEANYQQRPIDIVGRLYSEISTYDTLPSDERGNSVFSAIHNYTDTADMGDDFLCSICYGVCEQEAYVLDVIYSNESMEKTEPMVAKMLFDKNVSVAHIESNNGGRGFGRNVGRILRDQYKSNRTRIRPFHQSKNKTARILSNSTWVMEHVHFPSDWDRRYPDFCRAICEYQRCGKNQHDDAPDAVTGVAEQILAKEPPRIINRYKMGIG